MKKKYLGVILFALISFITLNKAVNAANYDVYLSHTFSAYNEAGFGWLTTSNGKIINVKELEHINFQGQQRDLYCFSPALNADTGRAGGVSVENADLDSMSCKGNNTSKDNKYKCSLIYILSRSNYSWEARLLAMRLLAAENGKLVGIPDLTSGDDVYIDGTNGGAEGVYYCSAMRAIGQGNKCQRGDGSWRPYWNSGGNIGWAEYQNAVKLYKASRTPSNYNFTNSSKVYTLYTAYPTHGNYQRYYFITSKDNKSCKDYSNKKIDDYTYNKDSANKKLGADPSPEKIQKECFKKNPAKKPTKPTNPTKPKEKVCKDYSNKKIDGYTYNKDSANKKLGTNPSDDEIKEACFNKKTIVSCDTATQDFNKNKNACSEYQNVTSFTPGDNNGTTEAYENLKDCDPELAERYKDACISCDCSDPNSPWDSCDPGSGDQNHGNEACDDPNLTPEEKEKCEEVCPPLVKATCGGKDNKCVQNTDQAKTIDEDLNKESTKSIKIDVASSIKPNDLKKITSPETSSYSNLYVKNNSNNYCEVYCVDNIEGISFPDNRTTRSNINQKTYLLFGRSFSSIDNSIFVNNIRYCFSVIKDANGLKNATETEQNSCLQPSGNDKYGENALANISMIYHDAKTKDSTANADFTKISSIKADTQYLINNGESALTEINSGWTTNNVNINDITDSSFVISKYNVRESYEPKEIYCVDIDGNKYISKDGSCNEGNLLDKYGNVIPLANELLVGTHNYNITINSNFKYGQDAVKEAGKECELQHSCDYSIYETSCKLEDINGVSDECCQVVENGVYVSKHYLQSEQYKNGIGKDAWKKEVCGIDPSNKNSENYVTTNASYMQVSVNNMMTNNVAPANYSSDAGKEAIARIESLGENTYTEKYLDYEIDFRQCKTSDLQDIIDIVTKKMQFNEGYKDQSPENINNKSDRLQYKYNSDFLTELKKKCPNAVIVDNTDKDLVIEQKEDGSYLIYGKH